MRGLVVLLCVAGWAVGDKHPSGLQSHHFTGQPGYDTFGGHHAEPPVYDSKGKGKGGPHPGPAYGAPAPTYGAPPPTYGPPKGDIPVVYYAIERPNEEKDKSKGYLKAFSDKMKGYSDKFTKFMKDSIGYGDYDYDYHVVPDTGYGPPADTYGPPPTDTYGPPPTDTYGPPPVVVDYHYDYEEEKDKGFAGKMKDYYSKFSKEMEKAGKKIKEMFGYGDYGDYDYEVVEVPAPGYGAPPSAYGAPAPAPIYDAPAPAYGAPAPHPAPHHEVVYQPISRPKEPKAEKGSFFKGPKKTKKPRPGPIYAPPQPQPYHAPVQHAPVHHAPKAAVHHAPAHVQHAPVHHAPAPVHHAPAPSYSAGQSDFGPPKGHDIAHGHAVAPVKAKGGHAHHAAPAPSAGVSSYTSH